MNPLIAQILGETTSDAPPVLTGSTVTQGHGRKRPDKSEKPIVKEYDVIGDIIGVKESNDHIIPSNAEEVVVKTKEAVDADQKKYNTEEKGGPQGSDVGAIGQLTASISHLESQLKTLTSEFRNFVEQAKGQSALSPIVSEKPIAASAVEPAPGSADTAPKVDALSVMLAMHGKTVEGLDRPRMVLETASPTFIPGVPPPGEIVQENLPQMATAAAIQMLTPGIPQPPPAPTQPDRAYSVMRQFYKK